jgi:hypothetical protein
MANARVILDPSKWVIDENGKINFRYRIVTDDLNVRSATSAVYSVQAPTINEIFSSIVPSISSESIDGKTIVRAVWTTVPQYDGMKYFVFVKKPTDSALVYNKTITETSFSYVIDNDDPDAEGTYFIAVTLPNTTKTVTDFTNLFQLPVTV